MKHNKLLVLFISLAFLGISCNNQTSKEEYTNQSEIDLIKEGKRLVTVLGCNDCHSSKKMTEFGPIPDENLLLSGHPSETHSVSSSDSIILKSRDWILFNLNGTVAIGPWGTSFASNLTPDETGIGNWTVEQFTKAMRKGKYKGLDNGRTLLPPMPWVGYKELKDSEILAIFKYLKSIKPIKNIVPAPIPPK